MRCFVAELPIPALKKEILLAAKGEEGIQKAFYLFANATGLCVRECAFPPPEAAVTLLPASDCRSLDGFTELGGTPAGAGRFWFHPETRRTVIRTDESNLYFGKMVTISRTMVCCGILSLVLQDREISLLHGALLQIPFAPYGIILFGESGIGKSTAAKRFFSNGGIVLADDKIILSRNAAGEFWAQPIPTWSRWLSREKASVAVNTSRPVRVGAVLQLTRGREDQIVVNDRMQWRLGLLRALGEHYGNISHYLTSPIVRQAVEQAGKLAAPLQEAFGSYELYSDLNENLLTNLGRFMQRRENEQRMPERPGRDNG